MADYKASRLVRICSPSTVVTSEFEHPEVRHFQTRHKADVSSLTVRWWWLKVNKMMFCDGLKCWMCTLSVWIWIFWRSVTVSDRCRCCKDVWIRRLVSLCCLINVAHVLKKDEYCTAALHHVCLCVSLYSWPAVSPVASRGQRHWVAGTWRPKSKMDASAVVASTAS